MQVYNETHILVPMDTLKRHSLALPYSSVFCTCTTRLELVLHLQYGSASMKSADSEAPESDAC